MVNEKSEFFFYVAGDTDFDSIKTTMHRNIPPSVYRLILNCKFITCITLTLMR